MTGVRHLDAARTFAEHCLDASEALKARGYGLDTGRLLAVYPQIEWNPYLRMLYAAAFEHGFAPVPLKDTAQLDEVPPGLNMVVHFHWLHRIFDKCTDAAEANKAVDHLLKVAARQKAAGRTLLWTLHNVTSHRSRFLQQEVRLRAAFAELVDHIHIMNPKTAALCAPHYKLEFEKLFHVPHPSYQGVYGDYISAATARLSLGLQPADKVFLLFGALEPYKGVRTFLAQLDALQAKMEGTAKIIIAGREGAGSFMEDMYALTAGRADVQLHLGHIGDQSVQTYFRAADVAVCAHRAGLNSGVAATALTFGCPTVIADRMAGCVEGAEDFLFTFDAEVPATIVDACAAAYQASTQANLKQGTAQWAQTAASGPVSARFFEALSTRL
jgi:beta-1,4-mannosyltransferase